MDRFEIVDMEMLSPLTVGKPHTTSEKHKITSSERCFEFVGRKATPPVFKMWFVYISRHIDFFQAKFNSK